MPSSCIAAPPSVVWYGANLVVVPFHPAEPAPTVRRLEGATRPEKSRGAAVIRDHEQRSVTQRGDVDLQSRGLQVKDAGGDQAGISGRLTGVHRVEFLKLGARRL